MKFTKTKAEVANREAAPDSFLTQLVTWAKSAPDDIFAPNDSREDLFALIAPMLGNSKPDPIPEGWRRWDDLTHRKAGMLEAMRVHAGFESSWNWREGVDVTNRTSQAHIEGQETGIFQVSFDSTHLNGGAMRQFVFAHGIETPEKFIVAMKANHGLALEYYARLARVNIKWAGPLLRHEVDKWLSRDAVAEFRALLAA